MKSGNLVRNGRKLSRQREEMILWFWAAIGVFGILICATLMAVE